MKCPKCQTDNPSDSKYCKECATPLPSSRDVDISCTKTLEAPREELTTGSTFAGRYQVIEELGHGGMGRIYRAVDKKLNEAVALKLIKSEGKVYYKVVDEKTNSDVWVVENFDPKVK